MRRKIVVIDEEKCNGCGLCVPECHEGAIQIIDGKARLIADKLCDGLGDCLGHCPEGALTVQERDADAFDMEAVKQHLAQVRTEERLSHQAGCPGSRLMSFQRHDKPASSSSVQPARSELAQWPVQLALVPSSAPYLQGADLLIAADCVPFAYPDFHRKLLRGKVVVIACPKLDRTEPYIEKLTSIIKDNDLNSVTVAHMEVPCCFGLLQIVKTAMADSGRIDIPVYQVNIGVRGDIKG